MARKGNVIFWGPTIPESLPRYKEADLKRGNKLTEEAEEKKM